MVSPSSTSTVTVLPDSVLMKTCWLPPRRRSTAERTLLLPIVNAPSDRTRSAAHAGDSAQRSASQSARTDATAPALPAPMAAALTHAGATATRHSSPRSFIVWPRDSSLGVGDTQGDIFQSYN